MESFLTPVLVGRSQELSQLEHALAAARGGAGGCVLLSGEAGIGKSRLLAEIRDRAVDSGFLVLIGRCFEQDMAFPYAPLIDMLRTLFARRGVSDIFDSLGSQAPELVKLLPELAAHVSAAQPAASLEPEAEKRRLFEALVNFFLRQTETQPLVLTVEDLHWSDAASLGFLLFLVRRIAPYPFLLLLSYRPAETNAGLTPLLTGLDREPIGQALKLNPLTRGEVEQMLQAILDQPQPPSAEIVEAIYDLTDGNPFFTEEIFTALIATGDIYFTEGRWRRKPLSQISIPGNVQRLVQQRLGQISQTARQLLNLAAVSGRSFDFAVLQALTGHNDSQLLALVKERRKMMKANAKTEAAVLAVLNKFMETYQKRDIEGLMGLFAPDDDQIMFGTGADEKRIGRDQIRFQAERDWSQTEALAFNLTWHQVSAAGPVAWVAAEGLGQGKVGGQKIEFPVRMTTVLEQRDDEWLLVQSHVSLPAPGQEEGDSVPV